MMPLLGRERLDRSRIRWARTRVGFKRLRGQNKAQGEGCHQEDALLTSPGTTPPKRRPTFSREEARGGRSAASGNQRPLQTAGFSLQPRNLE